MVLIETVGQKKQKNRDSETSRPKIRESETQRNTRKRDFGIHSKRLRDFEMGTKIPETLNFRGTIRHPFYTSFFLYGSSLRLELVSSLLKCQGEILIQVHIRCNNNLIYISEPVNMPTIYWRQHFFLSFTKVMM